MKKENVKENEEVGSKIWDEIKDKTINVFGFEQKVSDYCSRVEIDPSRCFLLFKASAVLPALELVIGKNYAVEAVNKYFVVSRVVKDV